MVHHAERVIRGCINSRHIVQLFDTPSTLAQGVSTVLTNGFKAGEPMLVAARAKNWKSIATHLEQSGCSVREALSTGLLTVCDADRTLASFYEPRSGINRTRFHRDVDQLIRQASARGQPVRIFGEMVVLLLAQNRPEIAIELEELWNEASRHHNFALLCTYPTSEFTRNPRYRQLLRGVHSHAVFEDA